MAGTDRPVHHGDARIPSRARLVVVTLLFLLLIVSVVPWRNQSIYEGGLDFVVVAKGVVSIAALALTILLWMRTRVRIPIGLGPAAVLGTALLITLLGSLISGNASSTVVLVVRVFIVMVTLLVLLTCVPWLAALVCLFTSMGALAVVAGVTGIRSYAAEGRLGGGIPEFHPNELAGLCGPPLIALIIFTLRRGVKLWVVVAMVVLLGLLVATGSRTPLAGLAVATVIAVLTNGVRDRSVVYALLLALPLAYGIANFTGVLGSLASRGGSNEADIALDSRFDAWSVILAWPWTAWEKWIGLGLSVKTVKVDIKWRDTQVLDSSWVSLLAQVGIVGVALVGSVLAWCVVAALVSSRRRNVILPILTLILIRTFTESGLLDSAMPFVLLVTVSALLTHRSRHAEEMLAGRRDLEPVPRVPAVPVGLG